MRSQPRPRVLPLIAVLLIALAAVDPGVLPEHRLELRSADFALTLAPLSV
jgi:hypothetical protein